MSKIRSIFRLIRPMQWVKNGFVFVPLFFGGKLLDPECWIAALWVFMSFSLMASSIYCLNDIKDVEADRAHPRKRLRPIASGEVSVKLAYAIMACLIFGALSIPLLVNGAQKMHVVVILVLYLVLNILYCLKLKQYAIVDVFTVSLGFVLRLVCGGVACDIWLSPWIICMTFLLALFLAFAKRRDDVVLHDTKGIVSRKNILRYNIPFMNQVLGIIGSVTIVCYIIYTVSPEVERRLGSDYVFVTSIFVLAGILRYLQVSMVDLKSGSPTKILMQDRFIQYCILCWLFVFAIILYF